MAPASSEPEKLPHAGQPQNRTSLSLLFPYTLGVVVLLHSAIHSLSCKQCTPACHNMTGTVSFTENTRPVPLPLTEARPGISFGHQMYTTPAFFLSLFPSSVKEQHVPDRSCPSARVLRWGYEHQITGKAGNHRCAMGMRRQSHRVVLIKTRLFLEQNYKYFEYRKSWLYTLVYIFCH